MGPPARCLTRHMNMTAQLEWTIAQFGSKLCKEKKPSEFLQSISFHAPGDDARKWILKLYPSGLNEEMPPKISLYVYPATPLIEELQTTISFSLTDENKPLTPLWSATTFYKFFSSNLDRPATAYGYPASLSVLQSKFTSVDNLCVLFKLEYKAAQLFPVAGSSNEEPADYDDCSLTVSNEFKSMNHPDVIFVIGEETKKEFQAHKLILSARSPVFTAMFEKEADQNRVHIVDIEPDTFQVLLEYIYSDKVDDLTFEMSKSLLAASNQFHLRLLKWKCELFLIQQEPTVDNCLDLLVLAHSHGAENLKESTINFIATVQNEVMKTEGWKEIKTSHPVLIIEVLERNSGQQELTVNNCLNLLIMAHSHGAENLKESIINFIATVQKEVMKTKGWKEMKISHPVLAFEILEKNYELNYVLCKRCS